MHVLSVSLSVCELDNLNVGGAYCRRRDADIVNGRASTQEQSIREKR
jgi:hypothetical protein